MKLEHIAIWTDQLEVLKDFYIRFFNAVPNTKYINPKKNFQSYFLSFESGARLEIMSMPGVSANLNDTIKKQHKGIIHMAFEVDSIEAVNAKAKEMQHEGFEILDGPRQTGDGYYEFTTLDPDNNRLEITAKYL